jgi:hypothetical protein
MLSIGEVGLSEGRTIMTHCGRVVTFGVVLLAIVALAAPEVGAQKKKDNKDKSDTNPALPADYKSLQKAKEVSGIIVSVSGTTVTFKLDYPHLENNPKYKPPTVTNPGAKGYNAQANQQYRDFQQQQRLMKDYQQAMNAKNPQERARALQRYQQEMARFQQNMQRDYAQLLQKAAKDPNYTKNNANNTTDPFIVVHAYKEYELELQDKVVFRKMFLPFEFDDAGNPKQYTEKEKTELRGTDKTKPGYKAAADEATPGTEAKFHLTAPKKTETPKPKDKDDPDGVGNVERPTVNMVVLTKYNANPSTGAPEKKKKDKK